jgi:hypothetical protein
MGWRDFVLASDILEAGVSALRAMRVTVRKLAASLYLEVVVHMYRHVQSLRHWPPIHDVDRKQIAALKSSILNLTRVRRVM